MTAEAQQREAGNYRVREEQDQKRDANGLHGRFAHQTVEAKEKRLNKVNHAKPQQAKGNERIGAYPAIQVKFLSGIIPPPCVKRLLHDIARQVFQRAAQQHR